MGKENINSVTLIGKSGTMIWRPVFVANPAFPCSEEQTPLEDFFAIKKLKTKNEMVDDVSCSLAPTMIQSSLLTL